MLINKYKPATIDECVFHEDKRILIKNMCTNNEVPHLIFYGPKGSGKKTLIEVLLRELYKDNMDKIYYHTYNVTGSGNKIIPIDVRQSNCHMIIEPTNTNFDKYLIQDVVREYLKKPATFIFGRKSTIFKTIIINNVDNLSYYAQTSLRRTIELNSGKCRFIMWTRSLSKVMAPLRSRCFCMCIKYPSKEECFKFLLDIASKEQLDLSYQDYQIITEKSKNNIKTMLWYLELFKYKVSYDTPYDMIMDILFKLLLTCELKYIKEIELIVYNVVITIMSSSNVMIDQVNKLLMSNFISEESKETIIKTAASIDYNYTRNRREIIHFGNFVIKVMNTLYHDPTFISKRIDDAYLKKFIKNNIKTTNKKDIDVDDLTDSNGLNYDSDD
jgi:replication factor C subunit 3/5